MSNVLEAISKFKLKTSKNRKWNISKTVRFRDKVTEEH